MIPGIAFRTLQRDTAVDHQHLAGDIAGVVAEQEFHGVSDVPAGTFRLQHGGVGVFRRGVPSTIGNEINKLKGSLWRR